MRNPFFLLTALCLTARLGAAPSLSIEGGPSDTGFNIGSVATIEATVRGVSGDESRYAAFADIQYVGTSMLTSVEMDRQPEGAAGELRYTTGWPIPSDAPTGLYSVVVRVEDRKTREVIATQTLRGFAAYKKPLRIARVRLDKTFYSVGQPIQCEVELENLTDGDLKGLRVEFSNANYPWISLFSKDARTPGKQAENPELALKVVRDSLALPPRATVNLPMMPAGTAAFLQGQQVAVMGTGGPARHETLPPSEVDQYTVAVWNAERTVLYDMQFSPMAVVRPANRDLPKPYSHNFTHSYNSDIDFTKYRKFYGPGRMPPNIRVNHERTLYHPGDHVVVRATVEGPERGEGPTLSMSAKIKDSSGRDLNAAHDSQQITHFSGGEVNFPAWIIPATQSPGLYSISFSATYAAGAPAADTTTTEIAVNNLPASLLVFAPHEDDEHSYAGLIRAAVEAGIPVKVVILTGGDVGACERYYQKACGPNEAREFGMVRMEESAEALEHIGLTRHRLAFMGLPDGGSGAIWSEHIKVSSPFMSIYLATDHAPYENILKPNLPYARDAVIEAIKQIIADFHPALIATPHPDERHVDHRTTNWFVIKACQELLRDKRLDPQTIVLADQAYGAGGFKPAPYRYEKWPVYLSGEAAALKQEMGWIYQSQDGNLTEGMRRTFDELPREEVHYRIVDWQEHAGWNE